MTGCAARISTGSSSTCYYNDDHVWDDSEVGFYARWESETHRDHKDFDGALTLSKKNIGLGVMTITSPSLRLPSIGASLLIDGICRLWSRLRAEKSHSGKPAYRDLAPISEEVCSARLLPSACFCVLDMVMDYPKTANPKSVHFGQNGACRRTLRLAHKSPFRNCWLGTAVSRKQVQSVHSSSGNKSGKDNLRFERRRSGRQRCWRI